jgi:hypothetical protein
MQLFRHKLIRALLAREKITPRLVEILQNWRHPGFSVYQGERIDPDGAWGFMHLQVSGRGRSCRYTSKSPILGFSTPRRRFHYENGYQ